jgi:carboxyl-terminal processing protease
VPFAGVAVVKLRVFALVVAASGSLWATAACVARAEESDDPALRAVEHAYRHIQSDYVDPIDDGKLLRAARDAFVSVTTTSTKSTAQNATNAASFEDLAAQFRNISAKFSDANARQSLAVLAIDAMVASLDRHSVYLDPLRWRNINSPTPIGGVGLSVRKRGRTIEVANPIEGGPADRAGIVAGDVIKAVNGLAVSGQSLDAVVSWLRGPPGSKVILTVSGPQRRQPTDVLMLREVVHDQTIFTAVDDNVAVLAVRRFNDRTADDLRAALKKIDAQRSGDIKGYVIDLRGNGGGVLEAAIAFADDFLDSGVIATMHARSAETERFAAKTGDLIGGKPMAVLIDGETAAGAEIVAAALQANHRAIVIGTRSAGAGTIQTVIALDEGYGAMRLTTARAFTPSGDSLDGRGVTPDETVVDLQAPPSGNAQSSAGTRDVQLQAALMLLGRRQ